MATSGGKKSVKVSANFRDNKSPLYRFRLPFQLLGLPLTAGFSGGDATEFGLSVGSNFGVGPTARLAYHPNDENVQNQLIVKAGLGPWLTPKDAFLSVSAEFDLKHDGDTRIWIRTRPALGDFTLRREALPGKAIFGRKIGEKPANGTTESVQTVNGESDGVHVAESGPLSIFRVGNRTAPVWGPKPNFGHWTVKVNSEIPVGKLFLTSLRWGATVPREFLSNGGKSLKDFRNYGLPTLILDKITFEPARQYKRSIPRPLSTGFAPPRSSTGALARLSDDVILLHTENSTLRKSIEDLRSEFSKVASRRGPVPANSPLSSPQAPSQTPLGVPDKKPEVKKFGGESKPLLLGK